MNLSGNIFVCFCAALLLAAGVGRAETVLWSDSFETNTPSRWTTNNVWKIGSPTTGPPVNSGGYRTYSGTNCAATGLTSSAPADADTRLICTNYNGSTNLMIPDASQYPRLRFWQWYDFVNALGYVEINAGGGWQPISSTNISVGSTANTSSGVWSRPSIDLSAFAGQSVQIAFHFTSGGNGYGSDPGWYVDDVAVVTNSPIFNNPERFEAGLGDWSVDAGTWEVGTPTSGPNKAHGGTNCAATVLAGDYGWNMDTRLISPPFAVPATNSTALRFWQWYSFVNAGGFVEINTGNGGWQSISQTNMSVGSASVASGGWTNASIDLSAYANQTVQVAFHFQSGGSGWGNAPGWYVDDIALVASPTLTVPPTQAIYAGQTLVVTNYATLLPTNGIPRFALVSGPTNMDVSNLPTNGVLTWTPATAQAPSTNTITVEVTETDVPALSNTPALSTTSSFIVQVLLPPAPTIAASAQPANGSFQLTFSTISNTTWRIDASTNLLNWQPLLTNTAGPSGTIQFTNLPATNYPWRFYRAVLQ